jgi:hypothetical protein
MTQRLFRSRRTALIPSGDGTVKNGNARPGRYLTRKFASLGQRFGRERIDSGVRVVEDEAKSGAPVETGSIAGEEIPLDGKVDEPTTDDPPGGPKKDVQPDTTDEAPSQLLTPKPGIHETESTPPEAQKHDSLPSPPSSADEQTQIPASPALTPAEITFLKEKAVVSSILHSHTQGHIAEWAVVAYAAKTSTPSLLRHITVVTAKRVLKNQLVDMDVAELTPKMVQKIHSVYQLGRVWDRNAQLWMAFEMEIEFVWNDALYARWKETREIFRAIRGKSTKERVLFHGTLPVNLTPY